MAGAVHARHFDRAQDPDLRRAQVVRFALLNLLCRALLAGVLAPVRLRGRWGGSRRRFGAGVFLGRVFLGLGRRLGGGQQAQSGRVGGGGEQGGEDLGAHVRCFRRRGARSSVPRGCGGFLGRQALGLLPAVGFVRDLLPGSLGRVGPLPGHLQGGGDLKTGGMLKTLHGDLRQQLRQVFAEPDGDDLDVARPRAHVELQGEGGAYLVLLGQDGADQGLSGGSCRTGPWSRGGLSASSVTTRRTCPPSNPESAASLTSDPDTTSVTNCACHHTSWASPPQPTPITGGDPASNPARVYRPDATSTTAASSDPTSGATVVDRLPLVGRRLAPEGDHPAGRCPGTGGASNIRVRSGSVHRRGATCSARRHLRVRCRRPWPPGSVTPGVSGAASGPVPAPSV